MTWFVKVTCSFLVFVNVVKMYNLITWIAHMDVFKGMRKINSKPKKQGTRCTWNYKHTIYYVNNIYKGDVTCRRGLGKMICLQMHTSGPVFTKLFRIRIKIRLKLNIPLLWTFFETYYNYFTIDGWYLIKYVLQTRHLRILNLFMKETVNVIVAIAMKSWAH